MDVVNARVWRVFIPLYFVASTVVAALSPLLFGDIGVVRFPLGPLAYLATAFPGVERRIAIPAYPVVYEQAIYWYINWTILLMLCLALTLRKTPAARLIGFSLAAMIWFVSAAMIAPLME
jgi:hypothetical protein